MREVNVHANIIADTVFHTFPYNKMIPNFKGPHAEDCGGCIINAEVEKLVNELSALSPVKKIVAELEDKKDELQLLMLDRRQAFEKAGVTEEGSITDLVTTLVHERDRLASVINTLRDSINTTAKVLNNLKIE
jgi:Zn-finger protein